MAYVPVRAYRPCVGIMLVNDDNNVFIGKRIKPVSDSWQMPQGGIDKGEEPETAAWRELREETGVTSAEKITESASWLDYKLPEDAAARMWGGRYAGQRQKWFLMRYRGNGNDINIATDEPEFCSWRWERPDALCSLVVPFKRKLYEDVVAEFSACL